jgi:hypothetical protein
MLKKYQRKKYHFKGTYVALVIILKESLQKLCAMRGTGLDSLTNLITGVLKKVLNAIFQASPGCKRDLHSARMLRSVGWKLVTDVSEEPINAA